VLELYIANKNYSSWSLRPWVLMRQLQIPFTERLVPFLPESNWEAFRRFSPSGRVPCLHDGATVVWDSLAITEYLAERHAGVWPADAAARTWARCATAEMHSGLATLRRQCPMNCGIRVQLAQVSAALQSDIDRVAELWNEGIGRFKGPFLAGPAFTAVDAFFAPVVFRVRTYGLALPGAAAAYAQHLLAQPPMQAWLHDALRETWRDAEHEQDVARLGRLIADGRLSG
jgi:glutathione S-transferase